MASRQVSLNSVLQFLRRSPKCLSQSEVIAKNANLVEDVEILPPFKFC